MWNFLKADLQELVAVVKEDAASLGIPIVEGNMDNDTTNTNENHEADAATNIYDSDNNQKSPAQMEAERRMNIPETFTAPLLPRKAATSGDNNRNTTEKEVDEIHGDNLDSEPLINESSAVDDEGIEDTDGGKSKDDDDDDDDDVEMDEYELQEILEYLKAFNINDKQTQQDISFLLEEYKQTLQIQYDTLVPNHVQHEEFWERYFYRCDVARIEMEWNRAMEEQQEQRAGTKIVTSVTSFFGDAARAVATGMSNALTEDLQSYDNDDDDDNVDDADGKGMSSTARVLATSLFGHSGSSHRPPFVMNTAVDEDDGEEEEEIGWDDDEEDEEEQIVFDENTGGPVMSSKHQPSTTDSDNHFKQGGFHGTDNEAAMICEQLKEQLKQAIEERDILHQTVSLQTKEIATLKSATATEENKNATLDIPADIVPQVPTTANDNDSHVEMLRNQVAELSIVIRDRDNQAQEMKSQLETFSNELEERTHQMQTQFQQQIQELERTTSIERNDMIETMKQLEAEKVELQVQLQAAQSNIVASQTKIITLQAELEATQDQLKVTNERNVAVVVSDPVASTATTGLDETIVTDATTNMSSSGELTSATGVKVTVPPPTVVSKIPVSTDEDEEGWGDDWD